MKRKDAGDYPTETVELQRKHSRRIFLPLFEPRFLKFILGLSKWTNHAAPYAYPRHRPKAWHQAELSEFETAELNNRALGGHCRNRIRRPSSICFLRAPHLSRRYRDGRSRLPKRVFRSYHKCPVCSCTARRHRLRATHLSDACPARCEVPDRCARGARRSRGCRRGRAETDLP